MHNKRIAVLMTCYNRVDTTLECLRRLFEQGIPNGYSIDVWLVDDASPDKTGEKVKNIYPQVNVIQGTGGLFWCRGMRLAWDSASKAYDYDFYLWLNDDVILNDRAIASLLSDYDKSGGVIVGTFSSNDKFYDVSYGATKFHPDGMPRLPDKQMNGNLVLIPRNIYKVVGPIYGNYHHQYGDYDYGNMLKKHGLEFYASSQFSGVCPQQPERYHTLNDKSLVQRVRLLLDPKGYDLHDAFIFRYRANGLFRAFVSVFHVAGKVLLGR